jgi:hypothetical protein
MIDRWMDGWMDEDAGACCYSVLSEAAGCIVVYCSVLGSDATTGLREKKCFVD